MRIVVLHAACQLPAWLIYDVGRMMKIAVLSLLVLLLTPRTSGETPVPEFSGYFSLGKQHLFILTNVRTQKSSGWMTVGRTFEGFTIEEFDAEKDILVLRHGPQSVRVPLKASKVIASKTKRNPRTTSSHVEGGLELRMIMSLDGVLSLNGYAFPGETLDALFAVMARESEGLLLIIEQQHPKGEQSNVELLEKMMARMRAAGLKRGAINMTHAREEALKK